MKYIALLRGINVGGKHTVAMSAIVTVFENLGYSNVRTYINSGNVLFTAEEEHFSSIEDQLNAVFDFRIPVLFYSAQQLQTIYQAIQPHWQNNAEQKTDVLFLWPEYDTEESLQYIHITPSIDTVTYVPGAIIWHIEKKDYKRSGMKSLIQSPLYKNVTVRNCNTVRKLEELLNAK